MLVYAGFEYNKIFGLSSSNSLEVKIQLLSGIQKPAWSLNYFL